MWCGQKTLLQRGWRCWCRVSFSLVIKFSRPNFALTNFFFKFNFAFCHLQKTIARAVRLYTCNGNQRHVRRLRCWFAARRIKYTVWSIGADGTFGARAKGIAWNRTRAWQSRHRALTKGSKIGAAGRFGSNVNPHHQRQCAEKFARRLPLSTVWTEFAMVSYTIAAGHISISRKCCTIFWAAYLYIRCAQLCTQNCRIFGREWKVLFTSHSIKGWMLQSNIQNGQLKVCIPPPNPFSSCEG